MYKLVGNHTKDEKEFQIQDGPLSGLGLDVFNDSNAIPVHKT